MWRTGELIFRKAISRVLRLTTLFVGHVHREATQRFGSLIIVIEWIQSRSPNDNSWRVLNQQLVCFIEF